MLFQQNYLPGAFPAERFYHHSQKHLQQQPPLPSFPQDNYSRVRPPHPDLDSSLRSNYHVPQQQQQQHDPTSYVYPQPQQQQQQQPGTMPIQHDPDQQQASQLFTATYSAALSQYQQLYQQYYHEQQQSQQPAQSHYLPSIMLPPQSPTLASYYFEGANGWVNHYYDPKRRQYLSPRVDPHYHHRQQHDMGAVQAQQQAAAAAAVAAAAASQLPTLDSLGLNPQQFQMAVQQQQMLQMRPSTATDFMHHRKISSQQQQQQQPLYPQQPYSSNTSHPHHHHLHDYLGPSSSSSAAQPQSMINVEYTDEWRENMLQYAHSLYSSNPRNSMLPSILHVLHDAFPSHLPTLLLLACVYYTYQDYQSSLRYNQLILKYDPNYVEAMSNIGTTLRSMGRTAEAEQWWYQAVKLRPGYWDAVENLVGVLCSTGDNRSTSDPSSSKGGVATSTTMTTATTAEKEEESGTTTTKQQRTTTYPRYKEALGVCEFVEQYFYKEAATTSSPIKPPKQLPIAQLPRLQNLFYAKGNLKYALGDIAGARREYEKGLELVFGGSHLVAVANHIALACGSTAVMEASQCGRLLEPSVLPLVLLQPDQAVRIIQIAFAQSGGVLPGLAPLTHGSTSTSSSSNSSSSNNNTTATTSEHANALQQANQTTSTILLTLAKLFQDMMNPATPAIAAAATAEGRAAPTMSLLLPLYYLSLALHPSPSTANNLGIILSNISGASAAVAVKMANTQQQQQPITGTMLAMQYYMYGLQLDPRHPHLYTNLGSLLKDMGHLHEAVCMYEKAVEYNPQFDVALANLGNAIKDMGRVQDSVQWYRRAVEVNPNFVDAVCGLVNSLGGVCDWRGRGGVGNEPTVDAYGHFVPATGDLTARSGWIGRVVDIVEKQLDEGAVWGVGILKQKVEQNKSLGEYLAEMLVHTTNHGAGGDQQEKLVQLWTQRLAHYAEGSSKKTNEGGWVIRLIERILRRLQRRWYIEHYGTAIKSSTVQPSIVVTEKEALCYQRPAIPGNLAAPPVPTVLPFHTFTYPLSARQVRLISHRNALRISHGTLTSSWVAGHVYPPPPPPAPRLRVGYVSSDFNNHPLAHLMQSVFGFHDRVRYEVFCYATTPSDGSPYRHKIERESEHFIDVSGWSNQQVVERIVQDGIHVLVNLNGYTKGARNEIFAARPSPVQCSFMGFAGTLGGGWCDWIIADPIVCPPEMVSCEVWRSRSEGSGGGDFEGDIDPEENTDDFVYTEKFIYMPHSYFVNDHKQGFREDDESSKTESAVAPPVAAAATTNNTDTLWDQEQDRRWTMRQEVFPTLPHDVVIFANFNQLYKLEPGTFRMWLRILERVPHSVLWLLRFPPAGERHLRRCATEWAGPQVANRVIFTDVAPKHVHIHRGRVADIFLDTPECNAHTTAADILWSGTPIVTWPKYMHKMCSRVGASIAQATGFGSEMVVETEQAYEDRAVQLALGLQYSFTSAGQRRGHGELMDLRKRLYLSRESSRLFDTARWTLNLERGYSEAWRRWVTGQEFEDVVQDTSNPGSIWVVDPDDK